MPYGVCGVAFGMSRPTAASSGSGTGAPAERNVRTPASAVRSSAESSPAVATTFAIAAGARTSTVPSAAAG